MKFGGYLGGAQGTSLYLCPALKCDPPAEYIDTPQTPILPPQPTKPKDKL